MRKSYTLGLAFAAVFAFCAVAASAAFAKEWLWNGEPVTALLATVTEGELLMEDTKASIRIDVLCSGKLVGSVGSNGEDEITLVEGLNTGEDNVLDCVAHEICNSGLATLTAIHLPAHSQIELMTNGEILDVITGSGGELGYRMECQTFFGTFIDECEPEPTTHAQLVLTNAATDVLVESSENETISPRGRCTMGGAKSAVAVGTGLVFTPEGGTLSVS